MMSAGAISGAILVRGTCTRTRTCTVGANVSLAAESESFRAKGQASLVLASLSKYFFSGLQSCCFSMRVGDPARLLDLAGNCGVWLIDFKQVCTESNHD